MKRILLALACAAFAAIAPFGGARADELTASTTLDTFSSAGDLYGPWQTELLEYQWQAGKNDIPSVTILNRNDHDRNALQAPSPTRSTAIYLDDYHNWSNTFFTYAQVMTSDGNVLPNRLIYIEGDAKFGKAHNFVVGVGGSAYANPDASYTRSLSIGPTLYTHAMVYSVRYLPAAVAGTFSGFDQNGLPVTGTTKSYGSGLEFVAEYNGLGTNQVIATYLGGNQPGLLVGSLGSLPSQFANIQHIGEFDLSVKHWFRRDFGIIVGGTLGSHTLQITGARIYKVAAITVGVFVGRAVGLPR